MTIRWALFGGTLLGRCFFVHIPKFWKKNDLGWNSEVVTTKQLGFFLKGSKKKNNMDSSCNLGVSTLRLFFCLLLVWQSCLRIGMVSMIWSLEIGFQPSFSRGDYPFEGNSNTAKIRGHFDGFFSENIAASFVVFRHTMASPSKPTQPAHPPDRPAAGLLGPPFFLGAPNPVRTTPEGFLPGPKAWKAWRLIGAKPLNNNLHTLGILYTKPFPGSWHMTTRIMIFLVGHPGFNPGYCERQLAYQLLAKV